LPALGSARYTAPVPTPARRLLLFVSGLAAVAVSLEWQVRAHEPVFAAATNRALAKAALLDAHGPVDVLFFGTSRLQDGVSPEVFSAALGEPTVSAFNLAFTSSSLPSLERLAQRYADRPGLRLVFLELSTPQLENGGPVWEESAPVGQDVEGRLTSWVHGEVRTIAHRQAFVEDNVVRLPALLWFAPALDGSETRVADQLAAFLGHREPRPEGFDPQAWEPVRWSPGDAVVGDGPPLPDARVDRLAGLAQDYRAHGVRTVFVVPPLTQRFEPAEERGHAMKSLFARLAKASGAEVWDYSSLPLPDRFFRGESHLNRRGRASLSEALAREAKLEGLLGTR
jgi:hypothetical protein